MLIYQGDTALQMRKLRHREFKYLAHNYEVAEPKFPFRQQCTKAHILNRWDP